MRRERNKGQRRLKERQTEERGAYLLLPPDRSACQHAHIKRERERDLKAKRKRKRKENIGTLFFFFSPVFFQLHLTFNLREQSLVQLRDDAMTRRAFRRSKAQIQIFQRRSRRVSFSSQGANAAGGCKYRRRRYGEYGEEEGREGGGEKRVAARRHCHCHRRACV